MGKVLNYSNFNFKNQTSKYEGKVRENRIVRVGNVMIDSLFNNIDKSKTSLIHQDLNVTIGEYGVLTLHRPRDRKSVV